MFFRLAYRKRFWLADSARRNGWTCEPGDAALTYPPEIELTIGRRFHASLLLGNVADWDFRVDSDRHEVWFIIGPLLVSIGRKRRQAA